MKVVIIGGVAGGATAAARLRRLDESAEIVVFERSGYISYANCGLPYYIGGTIADKSALTLQTPESFRARFNVDMRTRHEVEAVDAKRHVVTVRNLDTGEVFEEPYDKLILSPGARPTRPALPGTGLDRLFTLRTVEDTFAIVPGLLHLRRRRHHASRQQDRRRCHKDAGHSRAARLTAGNTEGGASA